MQIVVVGDVVTPLRRYDKMHILNRPSVLYFRWTEEVSTQVEEERTLKCLVEDIMTLGDFVLWNPYFVQKKEWQLWLPSQVGSEAS